jgi:hypothetical protein
MTDALTSYLKSQAGEPQALLELYSLTVTRSRHWRIDDVGVGAIVSVNLAHWRYRSTGCAPPTVLGRRHP